ncbi:MAG: type 2 lantipeptide synthetase LanM, partial [Acetobacteraceae bacterium]|nr:type 2 lantipeptide synthetase LanM [Acetobacteraceae bacterium]
MDQAYARLVADINARALGNLTDTARASLREALLRELCDLAAPALYERFAAARKERAASAGGAPADGETTNYTGFIADMRAGGLRRLFEDKPVLLRLLATMTRQWIDTSGEFATRLDADLASIRRDILGRDAGRVAAIEGDLSDPHNHGHSVQIVTFEDGARLVYKPKDLRLDVAWHALVERLNRAEPPVELRAARAIAGDGYGWTEFVDHTGCADEQGIARFFRRAGAWLALFHCVAASDMHQENLIASADHPVPIDLEMLLQASPEERTDEPEGRAFEAAADRVADSVMMVGLLPAYGKSPDLEIYSMGGMTSGAKAKTKRSWRNINSDAMRPVKSKEPGEPLPNLPHGDGRQAKFGDHVEVFIAGFDEYARFLLGHTADARQGGLLDGLAGLPVRKVVRPTQFYYMLCQRLRDHRSMDDGAAWSAQADFIARLADWDKEHDPTWPLQRAERAALLELNVPHFVSPSDERRIADAAGIAIKTDAVPGLDRARARVAAFDERDIDWQIDVIRQNTAAVSRSTGPAVRPKTGRTLADESAAAPRREVFIAEADRIAAELSAHAIRRGSAAAWIGLDFLGDSEVSQLVALGTDLYNGASGIALFLAAHAAVTGSRPSAELAHAAVALARKNLRSRNAARIARAL